MYKRVNSFIAHRQYSKHIYMNKRITWLMLCTVLFSATTVIAQSQSKSIQATSKGAFYTDVYPNLFKEAGYKQADIDAKVAKAYYDLFEGSNHIYFAVGDSMGYVSDLKNHDARTEGLSYGMMIAVQLKKKDVFDRIWRWSK